MQNRQKGANEPIEPFIVFYGDPRTPMVECKWRNCAYGAYTPRMCLWDKDALWGTFVCDILYRVIYVELMKSIGFVLSTLNRNFGNVKCIG